MRTLSLNLRLILVVLLPALLLGTALTGFLNHHSNDAADTALRDRALAVARFIAPAAEYGVISGNRHALESLLIVVLNQPDVVAASIVDVNGVLLTGGGELSLGPQDVLRLVIERDLRGAEALLVGQRLNALAPVELAPTLGIDDIRMYGESHIAHVIGWVHVEFDTASLNAYKQRTLSSTLAITGSVLLLTLLLAIGLSSAVTRPLARLAGAVQNMTCGRLDTRVPETADIAELHTLQQGFNRMADAIASSQQTMQARIDEATSQLAYQAMHDLLTGLPNRRAFEQALEEAVLASRRASDVSVLCFIDLDHFKPINDSAGHAAGDDLLKRIARLIGERIRANDLLCRIGGDEFGLILRGCSLQEAQRVADSLRQTVAGHDFEWEGHHFTVGLSIGLVKLDGRMQTPGEALIAADVACYADKRKGRNRGLTRPSPTAPDQP